MFILNSNFKWPNFGGAYKVDPRGSVTKPDDGYCPKGGSHKWRIQRFFKWVSNYFKQHKSTIL